MTDTAGEPGKSESKQAGMVEVRNALDLDFFSGRCDWLMYPNQMCLHWSAGLQGEAEGFGWDGCPSVVQKHSKPCSTQAKPRLGTSNPMTSLSLSLSLSLSDSPLKHQAPSLKVFILLVWLYVFECLSFPPPDSSLGAQSGGGMMTCSGLRSGFVVVVPVNFKLYELRQVPSLL